MEEVWKKCQASVYTRRCVFVWQASYLQGNLDEGARDKAREDYAAQRVVEESF